MSSNPVQTSHNSWCCFPMGSWHSVISHMEQPAALLSLACVLSQSYCGTVNDVFANCTEFTHNSAIHDPHARSKWSWMNHWQLARQNTMYREPLRWVHHLECLATIHSLCPFVSICDTKSDLCGCLRIPCTRNLSKRVKNVELGNCFVLFTCEATTDGTNPKAQQAAVSTAVSWTPKLVWHVQVSKSSRKSSVGNWRVIPRGILTGTVHLWLH